MTVERKNRLLTRHSLLHLRLSHAAIGTYPIHSRKNTMTVNRLLMIFEASGRDESHIRDSGPGKLFPLQAGFLYFIPCGHEIDIKLSDDLFFVSLQFNLDLFYGFDVFKNYGKCAMIKNPTLVAEVKKLINREDEIKTLCRINEIIFNLCVSLLSDRPDKIRRDNVNRLKYEPLLDFLKKSGDATATVEKLADMNKMRRDVFSRNFTRDMGITPKDFISSILMRKASEMLLMPGISVRAVSAKLKFSSEYYFSRFFKKHSGMPPKSFQRLNYETDRASG